MLVNLTSRTITGPLPHHADDLGCLVSDLPTSVQSAEVLSGDPRPALLLLHILSMEAWRVYPPQVDICLQGKAVVAPVGCQLMDFDWRMHSKEEIGIMHSRGGEGGWREGGISQTQIPTRMSLQALLDFVGTFLKNVWWPLLVQCCFSTTVLDHATPIYDNQVHTGLEFFTTCKLDEVMM